MFNKVKKEQRILFLDRFFCHWRRSFSAKSCVVQLLLLPTIFGVWYFGVGAFFVVLTSVVTCYVTGVAICLFEKKPISWLHSGSVLTGLLIGLTCGATTPLYMLVVGGVVAEFMGKLVFKRLGKNMLNPAVVGRSAIAILETIDPIEYADLSTGASALFKNEGGLIPPYYIDAFLGLTKGSIGETCALLFVITGFIVLRYVVIKWQAPVAMVLTVPILVAVLPPTAEIVGHAPWVVDPILFLIGSPILLLAFFFVTDPVSSPNTVAGGIVFGVGVGVFAVLGKLYTSIAGVEMYGILVMNFLTPYLNRLTFKSQRRNRNRTNRRNFKKVNSFH